MHRFKPTKRSGRTQRGVSLLLALLFVALFGGILVTIARFNSDATRISEARVAGWEAVEIAKAARLYMRDQLIANPALRTALTTPLALPGGIETLRTSGYLSSGFGRAGYKTALNQSVHVVMANWPLNGNPADNSTVPTAFVILESDGRTKSELMIQAVDNARKLGATINAPLFNGNLNISADCRGGGAAVGLWDTGCLRQDEYATLAGVVGAPAVFSPGGLIVPAWKVSQLDMRAVMRVPQPENEGYATMLTDLQMGSPTGDCSLSANQVKIKTVDAVSGVITDIDTGVCDVHDDDAANNNRFNINAIGNMTAERLVAEPQTSDHGAAEVSRIGTAQDDAMRVTGNVVLGADMRIFGTRAVPVAQAGQDPVNARFDIPNGSLAIERNAYVYSQDGNRHATARIQTIDQANALISDTLTSNRFESLQNGVTTGTPQMNVTDRIDINGNTTVSGRNVSLPDRSASELITENLNAPNAVMTASDATGLVQVSRDLELNGSSMTVNGTAQSVTGDYAAIAGSINGASKINVTSSATPSANDLVFGGSVQSNGVVGYNNSTLSSISTTGACLESGKVAGGCPDRQYVPPNITP